MGHGRSCLGRASLRVLIILGALTGVAVSLRGANPGPAGGFRDLYWGDHPSRNMYRLGSFAAMERYARHHDSRRVAGLDASILSYSFWHNRLCRVDVDWLIPDDEARGVVVQILNREWGESEKVSLHGFAVDGKDTFEWLSRDKHTWAMLSSPSSWRQNDEAHLWKLLIVDRKCADEAAEDPGLGPHRRPSPE